MAATIFRHIVAGPMPAARYQHSAVFVGARLHTSGGAVGGGRIVEESCAVVVLDTGAGLWCRTTSSSSSAEDWTRRCPNAPRTLSHMRKEFAESRTAAGKACLSQQRSSSKEIYEVCLTASGRLSVLHTTFLSLAGSYCLTSAGVGTQWQLWDRMSSHLAAFVAAPS